MVEDFIAKCAREAAWVRKQIVTMAYNTGNVGAHLGGSLSLVELLICLYLGNIKYKKNEPDWEMRDRIILSKGHAAMTLYAVLAKVGIIDADELSSFKKDGSRLGAHPSLNGLPGIEFASGSLGQGLSLGVGTCLALKRKGNDESRVFVFLGDGECDEGSVWEAVASASQYHLNQLIAVIDMNRLQYDGLTDEILSLGDFEKKWESFGWQVLTVDGHNVKQILNAYEYKSNEPLVIMAHTVKGKGISFMENNAEYHNAALREELYKKAMEELETDNDNI